MAHAAQQLDPDIAARKLSNAAFFNGKFWWDLNCIGYNVSRCLYVKLRQRINELMHMGRCINKPRKVNRPHEIQPEPPDMGQDWEHLNLSAAREAFTPLQNVQKIVIYCDVSLESSLKICQNLGIV